MYDLKSQFSRDMNHYPNDLTHALQSLTKHKKRDESKNKNKQEKRKRKSKTED